MRECQEGPTLALGPSGEEARCFGHGSGRRRAAVCVAAALRARGGGHAVVEAVVERRSGAGGPFIGRVRRWREGSWRWPAGGLGGAPLMVWGRLLCLPGSRSGVSTEGVGVHVEEGGLLLLGLSPRGSSDEAASLCASSARTAARAARRPGDVTSPAAASCMAAWNACARAWTGGWR